MNSYVYLVIDLVKNPKSSPEAIIGSQCAHFCCHHENKFAEIYFSILVHVNPFYHFLKRKICKSGCILNTLNNGTLKLVSYKRDRCETR